MSLELSAINTVGEMKKSNPCEIIDCAALVNDFVFCFFFALHKLSQGNQSKTENVNPNCPRTKSDCHSSILI